MFYSIVRIISWILLKIFWGMKVKGAENIPKNGAVIIASNHVSSFDPFVLAASIDREIYFISKKEAFKSVLGRYLFTNLNAFPVDRENVDVLAFKKALKILQEGKILGIFPEGTRSLNGELQELKLGVIKIAMKTGVPVLPVGIIGTYQICPQGKKIPILFKHKIIANYGTPQIFQKMQSKNKEYQDESLNLLSEKIKELSKINN
ncbi:1-acyl-sn-glycerol-3-phosphate acyltransferase [bacterium]|nr:1-acyl-sn-glycerol-3-phosphate acyltransferase [bacterium]MBU4361857.1 1-acyl-sn-glycerol-3-phosphate acyltransferase [bacterium]MBU4602128.1 1-acyl-sn-glycerol-3-phosphate acyltransferase [bacterium]MCG2762251.1 1-acyl-sn-glycerol-3-phosphate acyltransferase [Candidatus Atribacteria bacterium]